MRKNILITGKPRSGKTTLLKKLIQAFPNKVGFLTSETTQNGQRTGFEIEDHLGNKLGLASINLKSDFQVSKYFVDVNNIDKVISNTTTFAPDDLLYIDEIGQMELASKKFQDFVLKFFNSPNICLATLTQVFKDDFTELIKSRDDIFLFEILDTNRNQLEEFIIVLVHKIKKAKYYLEDPNRFNLSKNHATITSEHGLRKLVKQNDRWTCDCPFFSQNNICSHILAVEEYLKQNE